MSIIRALLVDKRQEAKDTMSFFFDVHGKDYTWKPGQSVVVRLDELVHDRDDRGKERRFTIASSPTEEHVMITTRMRKNSGFKDTLRGEKVGLEVSLGEAEGSFTLPKQPTRPLVFLAGGIGVTPFRSMIRFVSDNNFPYTITFLNSNPTVDKIAYFDEFAEIESQEQGISIVHTLTKGEPNNWHGELGRINTSMIRSFVDDVAVPLFYVAGPPKMVDAMVDLLPTLGVKKEQIMAEGFGGY